MGDMAQVRESLLRAIRETLIAENVVSPGETVEVQAESDYIAIDETITV
jgi:hypothetical protein